MFKTAFTSAALFVVSGYAFAQATLPDPQIADVHVEIRHAEKVLFAGEALVSWKQPLVINTVRELPFKIECKPNHRVEGENTYHEGIKFEMRGITRGGRMLGSHGFEVYTVDPASWRSLPGQGCEISAPRTHKYSSSGGLILTKEQNNLVQIDDLTVTITLKRTYDKAPEDRPIDQFTSK